MKQTEHQIQTAIMQYLRFRGWYVMRLNSGKYAVGEGRSKRFIQGQVAGTPDLMAFREFSPEGAPNKAETELMFIEVKVPGNKPTALQNMKMIELEEYGARCYVATSIDDLAQEGI